MACERHVDIGVTCMYLYVCKCSSAIKTTVHINTSCCSKCTHVTQFVAYIYGEYCNGDALVKFQEQEIGII